MKKYLVDTSVIIDFLRQKEKQKTLFYKLAQDDLFVSIITHTELYAGKSVWKNPLAKLELKELFSGLTILNLEPGISENAVRIKACHHNSSLLDCIIAATAIYHDLELVTLNKKDFEKIEGVKLSS